MGKEWCSIARYKFQGTFAWLGLFLSATRKARLYLGYGVRLRLTHTRYFCPLFGVVLFFCESPRSLQSCVGFNLAKFLKTTTHLTVICIYDMSQKRQKTWKLIDSEDCLSHPQPQRASVPLQCQCAVSSMKELSSMTPRSHSSRGGDGA